MLSCDTFALKGNHYAGGRNLLAKNSDRPVGEAQPLTFAPAADHEAGETLHCTQLTIPQALHTYATLGSRPFWIWGYEMGANEKGLFIGNEAQGSRCPAESGEGLLGMDLLRLGLERAADAREAIEVIAGLLARYGQNANANLRYDRRYENSYMLVDAEEIWLMETAGREWAARRVEEWEAISNCYAIREDYDLCSPGMESFARERRWISEEVRMDFARAYTLPAVRQTHSLPRRRRMRDLISSREGALSGRDVRSILRDHFEGTILEPRFGPFHADFVSICMHAQDENSAQTAASMTFTLDALLGPVFRYAPSLPCMSVYLPVYWTGTLPKLLTDASGKYDGNTLWWCVERLAMAVSCDEGRFAPSVRSRLRNLEEELEKTAGKTEAEARALVEKGRKEDAMAMLDALTETSAERLRETSILMAEEICGAIRAEGGLYGPRREFLESYSRWADMPLGQSEG